MLLQPITVPFSKSTLKPSVYTLILNVSCSDFEYFSLKMGHIFLPSLKILSSKIKIPSI